MIVEHFTVEWCGHVGALAVLIGQENGAAMQAREQSLQRRAIDLLILQRIRIDEIRFEHPNCFIDLGRSERIDQRLCPDGSDRLRRRTRRLP